MINRSRETAAKIGTFVVIAILFCAGVAKLCDLQPLAIKFAEWGYPHAFMFVVGFAELLAAALFFMNRTVAWGAFLISGLMIGAAATHLMHGEAPLSLVPIAILCVTIWTAIERTKEAPMPAAHFMSSGHSEATVDK